MGRTLVLGGSVFVGRRLVHTLLEQGHEVTVLNRGKTPTELPGGVTRLVADRTDADQMRAALGGTDWDAIYDVSGFVMVAGGSDIDLLLDIGDNISPGPYPVAAHGDEAAVPFPPKQTTICPLGPSSVAPIVSAIRRFRSEFEAKITKRELIAVTAATTGGGDA